MTTAHDLSQAAIHTRTFDDPDDLISFERGTGRAATITIAGVRIVQETLQPGWSWNADMRPRAGGTSCQQEHLRYIVAGRFRITDLDGHYTDLRPGDLAHIQPGHTGYVLGDEPCIMLDITPEPTP